MYFTLCHNTFADKLVNKTSIRVRKQVTVLKEDQLFTNIKSYIRQDTIVRTSIDRKICIKTDLYSDYMCSQ